MAKTPSNEPEQFQPEPDTLLVEDQSLRYGFIQLPKLVLYARNLSRDAKLLYAVLLGYAWQEGRCFPGYHRLCEDMQASENAVRKYMRELEAINLLRQKRRGLGKTNIYTLLDLRTAKLEVQEPQRWGIGSRTSNSEVQEPSISAAPEPTRSEVAEPTNYAVKLETDELETDELETDGIGNSKIRRTFRYENLSKTEKRLSAETSADSNMKSMLSASAINDAAREHLGIFAQDLAREFNDAASLRSSTSRLVNLYHQTDLPMEDFIGHLYAARSVTKERSAAIRTPADDTAADWKKNKMSYFFAVLEDHLGVRERTYSGAGGRNEAAAAALPTGFPEPARRSNP